MADLDNLTYIMTTDAPNPLQMRVEYDADNNPIYLGTAVAGASSSDEVWTINKFTWTSGNMELKQTAFKVSWLDRATVTYS